jgi:hypothetical protein
VDGTSRYLRLHTIRMLVALCAAALVAMVVSASASAVYQANDITIRVVNNSPHHTASFRFCATGHVNINYEFGQVADPCLVTPFIVPYVDANGGRYPSTWISATYTGNPIGVIVQLNGGPKLFFYAKNPTIGEPFFQVGEGTETCSFSFPCIRTRYNMSAGELKTVRVGTTYIRFHREGDWNSTGSFLNGTVYKPMTIEICGASTTYCR